MLDRGRHPVLGVRVNAIDYDEAVRRVIGGARDRSPLGVTALAVHGVMTGAQDRVQRYRLNQLELVVPDGQPVRWALNLLYGTALRDRVYGPTLTLKVCEAAAREGLGIYLYGSRQDTLDRLAANLVGRFPALVIAGMQPSRFRRLSALEQDEVVAAIRDSGAAITLVGLGCPRQETWAYEYREALSMPVLAVGAAFDFHAGTVTQAPRWLQDRGLEWLYRLTREPRRLWRRYLLLNPQFLALLGLQALRLWRIDPRAAVPPPAAERFG